MREISQKDLNLAFGAGETDPNTQLLNDLGNNMAWGAALGSWRIRISSFGGRGRCITNCRARIN